jgi:hypothetical protein
MNEAPLAIIEILSLGDTWPNARPGVPYISQMDPDTAFAHRFEEDL